MTTTTLATREERGAIQVAAEWSREQVDLIKRTVAKDASDAELMMFLHVARESGLDPLRKQIYFIKRRWQDDNGKWHEQVTIQAGIDGMQARAAREKDYRGTIAGVVYDGDDFVYDKARNEVTRHTGNPFLPTGKILGAWSTTYREGMKPFTALVKFGEYRDNRSPMWKDSGKPSVMIEKVARATSLRRAYPEALGKLYEPSEMGAQGVDAAALPAAAAEDPARTEPPPEDLDQRPPEERQEKSEKAAPPPPPKPLAAAILTARIQALGAFAREHGMAKVNFDRVCADATKGIIWRDWTTADLEAAEKAVREWVRVAEEEIAAAERGEPGEHLPVGGDDNRDPDPSEGPTT